MWEKLFPMDLAWEQALNLGRREKSRKNRSRVVSRHASLAIIKKLARRPQFTMMLSVFSAPFRPTLTTFSVIKTTPAFLKYKQQQQSVFYDSAMEESRFFKKHVLLIERFKFATSIFANNIP